MSIEKAIKIIALRWTNSGGSHSDDLLEDIRDALKEHCDWVPRDIGKNSYDIDHTALLKTKEYGKDFYRATDEEWAAWLDHGTMTYNMRQWAITFFLEDEMAKEIAAL
jgi:hypothetical protein